MADQYSYATWADAEAYLPNIGGDANAERLFDIFMASMPAMVDPNLMGQFTNTLSLNLALHFVSVIWEGSLRDKFDASSYDGSTGPVAEIEGEQVRVKFSSNGRIDPWESDLTQTEFGQIYLLLVKSARTILGIDGKGKMWASM